LTKTTEAFTDVLSTKGSVEVVKYEKHL